MAEYALILLSTILVNNFVLVKFLGLCPFMGVSRKLETAMGMALATTFVLTLSSVFSYLVNHYILTPLGIEYMRTIRNSDDVKTHNFFFYFQGKHQSRFSRPLLLPAD